MPNPAVAAALTHGRAVGQQASGMAKPETDGGIAYGSVGSNGAGAYTSVDTGATASQVQDSGNGASVVSLTPTLDRKSVV